MDRNQIIIDEEYLDFIHAKPCLVCGKRPVDADHLKAQGQRRSKRNDLMAIPLCRENHRERHDWGNTRFELEYNLNLYEEAMYLLCEYIWAKRTAETISEL